MVDLLEFSTLASDELKKDAGWNFFCPLDLAGLSSYIDDEVIVDDRAIPATD